MAELKERRRRQLEARDEAKGGDETMREGRCLCIIKGDVSSVSFATTRRGDDGTRRSAVRVTSPCARRPPPFRSRFARGSQFVDLRVRLGERHLLREHLRDAQIAHFVPVPVRLVEHHGAVRAVFGFTVVRHVRDEVVHARHGSPVRPLRDGA